MYFVYGTCPGCLRVVWRQSTLLANVPDRVEAVLKAGLRPSMQGPDGNNCAPVSHSADCPLMNPKTEKWRPWRLEEVKLGQLLRHKNSLGSQGMITGRAEDFTPGAGLVITIGSKGYAASSVLTDFEKLDGTPCGVLE